MFEISSTSAAGVQHLLHEGATRFRNRFAPGACSLIFSQFDSMEQNPGAKILLRDNFWYRRGSFAPGACCGSVLQEQASSCVPALKVC